MSVLMITFNQEAFLAEAIESVLGQRTAFPFELVIGEDCSRDRTREIALHYQSRHPDRIRVLLQPRNVGWLRNSAATFGHCRGTYIAWLEGDDYWTDPDKLQLQVDLMTAHPDAIVCGARAYVRDDTHDAPWPVTPEGTGDTLQSWGARELFEGMWWFRTCTKMFPRDRLEMMPADIVGEDWLAMMWLIAHSGFGRVCFLDRAVGVYRKHQGGVWSSLSRPGVLSRDIRLLHRMIPWFGHADREFLVHRLRRNVEELLAAPGPSRRERIACASLAVTRSPADRTAWRLLVRSMLRTPDPDSRRTSV